MKSYHNFISFFNLETWQFFQLLERQPSLIIAASLSSVITTTCLSIICLTLNFGNFKQKQQNKTKQSKNFPVSDFSGTFTLVKGSNFHRKVKFALP